MTNRTPKRFIAGAVCPKCAARDRIVMFAESGIQYRECVECDFKDEIRLQSTPQELTTRVNKGGQNKAVPAEAVKLLDPDPRST